MAEFECKVVKIDDVVRHPNADTLAIVKIGGYDCITSDIEPGVERYKKGDYVVYIPEGAVVPDWLLQKQGFWKDGKGTLSGSAGNRVKAIRLRGILSIGILYPVDYEGDEFNSCLMSVVDSPKRVRVGVGKDVSEILGIYKYEPPVPVQMRGQVGSLFGYTKSYDIDSIQKAMDVFEVGEEVVVTEKLHGTLCQLGFIHNLPEDKRAECVSLGDNIYAFATSKGLAKSGLIQKNTEDNKDNLYVKVLNDVLNLDLHPIKACMSEESTLFQGVQTVAVYIFGEIFGPSVQSGFAYGKSEPEFRVFDVYYKYSDNTGEFLNDEYLEAFCKDFGLTRVPVLYKGPYSYEKMVELRDGNTVEGNNQHIREGIVIRTAIEKEYRGLPDNRAQVKFVSPAYLLKSTGEEIS